MVYWCTTDHDHHWVQGVVCCLLEGKHLGTNFSEIQINIHDFHSRKCIVNIVCKMFWTHLLTNTNLCPVQYPAVQPQWHPCSAGTSGQTSNPPQHRQHQRHFLPLRASMQLLHLPCRGCVHGWGCLGSDHEARWSGCGLPWASVDRPCPVWYRGMKTTM